MKKITELITGNIFLLLVTIAALVVSIIAYVKVNKDSFGDDWQTTKDDINYNNPVCDDNANLVNINPNVNVCIPKNQKCISDRCPPPLGSCPPTSAPRNQQMQEQAGCVYKDGYKGLKTLPEAWATNYCTFQPNASPPQLCNGAFGAQDKYYTQVKNNLIASGYTNLCNEAGTDTDPDCIQVGITATNPLMIGQSSVEKTNNNCGQGTTGNSGTCYYVEKGDKAAIILPSDRCAGYCFEKNGKCFKPTDKEKHELIKGPPSPQKIENFGEDDEPCPSPETCEWWCADGNKGKEGCDNITNKMCCKPGGGGGDGCAGHADILGECGAGSCLESRDQYPGCPCMGSVPPIWDNCCGAAVYGCSKPPLGSGYPCNANCDWCASLNHPHFDLNDEVSKHLDIDGAAKLDKVVPFQCLASRDVNWARGICDWRPIPTPTSTCPDGYECSWSCDPTKAGDSCDMGTGSGTCCPKPGVPTSPPQPAPTSGPTPTPPRPGPTPTPGPTDKCLPCNNINHSGCVWDDVPWACYKDWSEDVCKAQNPAAYTWCPGPQPAPTSPPQPAPTSPPIPGPPPPTSPPIPGPPPTSPPQPGQCTDNMGKVCTGCLYDTVCVQTSEEWCNNNMGTWCPGN